jgi:hypothetical protein
MMKPGVMIIGRNKRKKGRIMTKDRRKSQVGVKEDNGRRH